VPRAQIDERYFESSYYVTPHDTVGQDAFAVIRDAMRGKDMVALGHAQLGALGEPVIVVRDLQHHVPRRNIGKLGGDAARLPCPFAPMFGVVVNCRHARKVAKGESHQMPPQRGHGRSSVASRPGREAFPSRVRARGRRPS
jgi:hypothetical protein